MPRLTASQIVQRPRYHWLRDRPDARDYRYAITNRVQPNTVDLRAFCSTIEDQGPLGSCTGNAIAGAIELLNKRNNKATDISRLFIYYYERLIEGTVNADAGAYIRDGIKSCSVYGAPLEGYWPYVISRFATRPDQMAIMDAARRRVTLYERILNHAGCLDALANGYPVTIGFNVYSSFESATVAKTGTMPYPDVKKERLLGGHAVLLVGYNKNTQTYTARNSWGTGWGDRGYFYMPFKVIENAAMSSDFWVIKTVNNP